MLLDWIANGKPGGELVSPDKARKKASTPTVPKDQELKKSSTPRSEKPTVTPKKGKSGGKMTTSSQKKTNQENSSVANELDRLGLEEHELGEVRCFFMRNN